MEEEGNGRGERARERERPRNRAAYRSAQQKTTPSRRLRSVRETDHVRE